MVHWSTEERATINSVWSQVDVAREGADALTRLLVVYPWTQRYFSSFGNLSNATAIAGNVKVQAHGKKVLSSVGNAIQHLDDVKKSLSNLSEIHSQKLHVDPENFKRFGEVLIVVLASRLGTAFTPQVQATFEKFIAVLVAGLSARYL
ncbi:hemoglobin subunit beta-2-like [Bombina bombina]|uniref:hemoglobin subunit beta-2-like n=1 Tax=Bombina bombina TaxID=8345 RepID=UPI00235AA596|nr:hemoglobin subunit beta-2-like [Bombina bombina]